MPHDPDWLRQVLAVHVAAGAFCLVLAPLALASVKGSRAHRRWGKIYFAAITVVAATALVLAIYRPILFLALIAVLSFYLGFSGYRVLSLKRMAAGGSASGADWVAAFLALGACGALAGLGAFRPALVQNMSVVSVVLGLLGIRAASADLYRFTHKPAAPMFWISVHLERFIGSYIATLTAFSAVTLSRVLPHAGLFVWLWPATLGVPAIVVASVYYRHKFASSEQVRATP